MVNQGVVLVVIPRPQLSYFIFFIFSDVETLWAVTQLRLVIPKYPALISSSVFSGWDTGSGQPSSRRAAVQPKRDACSVSQEAAEQQQQQPEEEEKKKNQEAESDDPGRRPHISTHLASHLRSRGEQDGRTKTPTIFGHISLFL